MKRSDFNKVIKKLEKRFEVKKDGSDHIDYDVYEEGILITSVRSSHSPKDYQDQYIARNLHISRTELINYKQCTFSNEQLIEKLKEKGYWIADEKEKTATKR